jgi:hypothetical protein
MMTTELYDSTALPSVIDVAYRGYCERKKTKELWWPGKQEDYELRPASRPKHFLAFDTETVTIQTREMPGFDGDRWHWKSQNLMLLSARFGETKGMRTIDEYLVYPDDLPQYGVDQIILYVGTRATRQIVETLVSTPDKSFVPLYDDLTQMRFTLNDEPGVTLMVMPLSKFMKHVFAPIVWNKKGPRALLIGFNIIYDLSRLAVSWSRGTKRGEYTAWDLTLWDYEDKSGERKRNEYLPLLTIEKVLRFAFIQWKTGWCKVRNEKGERFKFDYTGEILDLSTLSFALTNRPYSLASAVEKFCKRKLDKDVEHGRITEIYIDYARNDVKATVDLARALLKLFDKHSVSRARGGCLSETRTYTPASLAKAYLRTIGYKAPKLLKNRLGALMAAFQGGWSEAMIRGIVPVILLDFKKMYQTVWVLMQMRRFLEHESIKFTECTERIKRFLHVLTLGDAFDPGRWPGLTVICWIKLPQHAPGVQGVMLMNKGRFIPELREFTNGMVPTYANPDRPDELVPVLLPGLVLSKLMTGETPEIVRAELMEPVGRRLQLKPVEMPGGVVFDPNEPTADFFKFLVEYVEGLKRSTTLAKEDLADGGKCVGNSGAYGIWAETNAENLQIDRTELVRLYIDEEGQEARLLHPEDPGRFFCIAIAGLITSAARLMLGLAHCCVQEKGGLIAFGDTDSLAIVSVKGGGDVLIEGELHRALSPEEVQEIISRFSPLNPYDGVKTILEIKTAGGKLEPVEAFVLNTKRYAIFDCDSVTVIEGKESVLGAMLSPIDLNPFTEENSISKDWIQTHAWPAMRANWEHGTPFPDWADLPAVVRLSVSNPRFLRHNLKRLMRGTDGKMLPKGSQIRPFNFFIASTCKIDGKDVAVVAAYERDPVKWRDLEWVRTDNGETLTAEQKQHLKTVGQKLREHMSRRSPEMMTQSGALCGPHSRGVLYRGPIIPGDRYIATKESLDLSQSPDRPFQNDEPVVVPVDDRKSEWHRVTVPAIRALGVQQVASRSCLKVSRKTLQRWMDSSNAPPRSMKLTLIEKKIHDYAVTLGLFDPGKLENPRSALTEIPERIEKFRSEIAHTASRLTEVWGSREAVAKMISTTVGTPVTERSIKTWLEPELLSQHPLATLNRITVTLALAVAEHLNDSDRSGRAKFSQHDIDNDLTAVQRLFLKDNLAILKPRLQPQPIPQGFDLYRFLHLIFPSLLYGRTDTAAAEMLNLSQSQVTRIKNGKLSITRITAKVLSEDLEAAWHLMMDKAAATAALSDWPEMPIAEDLELDTEASEINAETEADDDAEFEEGTE